MVINKEVDMDLKELDKRLSEILDTRYRDVYYFKLIFQKLEIEKLLSSGNDAICCSYGNKFLSGVRPKPHVGR